MNHHFDARRLVLIFTLVLLLVAGLPGSGPAAAYGGSGLPIVDKPLTSPGFPCGIAQPAQKHSDQTITSLASSTFCRIYTTTLTAERSLFGGAGGFQYLPWAPTLVGLVVLSFFALAGWCAWKMKGYRPRRKYHIGRMI